MRAGIMACMHRRLRLGCVVLCTHPFEQARACAMLREALLCSHMLACRCQVAGRVGARWAVRGDAQRKRQRPPRRPGGVQGVHAAACSHTSMHISTLLHLRPTNSRAPQSTHLDSGACCRNHCLRLPVPRQLTFLTSPIRGAGTDSAVAFELHGERGSSGRTAVAAGSAAFARGGSDAFCYARPWLGALRQLRVSIDDSAAAPGRDPWHLEAVVVSCARDQQVVTFPCGRWLSGSEPQVVLTPGQAPGLMRCEDSACMPVCSTCGRRGFADISSCLVAGPDLVTCAHACCCCCRYRFDVVTSSLRGAGTDGAVRLELVGSSTRAGPWLLDRVGALGRGQVCGGGGSVPGAAACACCNKFKTSRCMKLSHCCC